MQPNSKSKSVISLDSIDHEFTLDNQKICLFKALSLSVSSGETVSIVGPSGVGKSSLLLLLAGLDKPTAGQFSYHHNGQTASVAALRKQCGFVFQQFHLLPELTALHNLLLPLRLKGDKDADQKAQLWLSKVGLDKRANHKPAQLSGGEQQRIAIARAFVAEPEFIFADEPTGNLDNLTAHYIIELMLECAQQQGTGLVFVTHNMEFADQADRCFELNHRRLTRLVQEPTV
jgi:putative ABC transport system ATP-binding protein